jgi:hypothetical protein
MKARKAGLLDARRCALRGHSVTEDHRPWHDTNSTAWRSTDLQRRRRRRRARGHQHQRRFASIGGAVVGKGTAASRGKEPSSSSETTCGDLWKVHCISQEYLGQDN